MIIMADKSVTNFQNQVINLIEEYCKDKLTIKTFPYLLLLFPVVAVAIILKITGQNFLVNYEDTKSACFILVCTAIWTGLFNSSQIIVSERDKLKQRIATPHFDFASYLLARTITQFFLCLIQGVILSSYFILASQKSGHKLPVNGQIMTDTIIELAIGIILILFAADALGMLLSSFIKDTNKASVYMPYILIAELIFSGTLFELKGSMKLVSDFMISHYGMETLGTTLNLNELKLKVQMTVPNFPHHAESLYKATATHQSNTWWIIGAFIVAELLLTYVGLKQIPRDGRR